MKAPVVCRSRLAPLVCKQWYKAHLSLCKKIVLHTLTDDRIATLETRMTAMEVCQLEFGEMEVDELILLLPRFFNLLATRAPHVRSLSSTCDPTAAVETYDSLCQLSELQALRHNSICLGVDPTYLQQLSRLQALTVPSSTFGPS